MKKHIVVLTGAGISAESGLRTFRDADGLWEGHEVTKVATPAAWETDPRLVLQFYNERRTQLLQAKPNQAHLLLARLQTDFQVTIITQNVDDLHERAGSMDVIHLHGELLKVRSTSHPQLVYRCETDIHMGDLCDHGSQLRPHIVWFGESVPMIESAAQTTTSADYLMIVGTSLQVYPAAGLMAYAPPDTPTFYIDPRPSMSYELGQAKNLQVIEKPATSGVQKAYDLIYQAEKILP